MTQSTSEIKSAPITDKEKPKRSQDGLRIWIRRLAPIITPIVVIAFWQTIVLLEVYPTFIIPPPLDVFEKFIDVVQDGRLYDNSIVTLSEMLYGLGIGASLALILGYLIAKNPLLGDVLSPIIVAFQATPTLAYAPLLILWFGTGLTSKVVVTTIIVFFPMLLNVIIGIRSVPEPLRDLMRSLNASPWQTFVKLEIPSALPVILTGLKTSATLSVIGAVVGEFVGAKAGLGFMLQTAKNQFDTALVFVAIFTLTALALALYSVVSALEHALLSWQRR